MVWCHQATSHLLGLFWSRSISSYGVTRTRMILINPTPSNDAYMRQWIGSALVQIMACRLFGDQCRIVVNWTLRNKLPWIFNQNAKVSFTKIHRKTSSAKWRPFCPGGDRLTHVHIDRCQRSLTAMTRVKYECNSPGLKYPAITRWEMSLKEKSCCVNPTMHQSHIPQCIILKQKYTHISVTKWCIVGHLPNALWDLWDGVY